ncbi:glycosyltransferase family 4 protein [Salinibacter altiplanensis]|uniref:glycosyltransferase family 4 protein n=1 Tax=Salinibacter altiplanensis TaxID=1803181 RepID=UPI000C9ED23E|nr:glycosyltransferase family 4 protein [Salinibacter altiplanensis]
MNVLTNYMSNSRVLKKLDNTDYKYVKNLRGLTSIDSGTGVTLNDSHLSSTLYDLGYYMKRVQERSGIPLPFWPWMRENVVIPPSIARNVDVILARDLLPVQLRSDVPVVYETAFVPNDYVGASNYADRREEIEHELHKIHRFDTYILKTEESVERFVEAVNAVTGESVRDAVHHVPYFLPKIGAIGPDALDEKFSELRPIRILFVGSDGSRKGVHNLVEALNRIYAEHPDLRSAFEVMIVTRTDLPRCNFDVDTHDYLPREDVIEAFRRAHIFCMPTLKDSYGLVYVEAMASGCAVVADNSPVRREILDDGRAGLLSDPEDPDNIAEKLTSLIRSPDRACALAERARDRFQRRYHWRHTGEQYLTVLEKAASAS